SSHCSFLFCSRARLLHDSATTDISTLSLHDALPISIWLSPLEDRPHPPWRIVCEATGPSGPLLICEQLSIRLRRADRQSAAGRRDRKSTRLNSSHVKISYAVFCLKKKKKDKHSEARR